jgi:hypothetical protein
MDRCLRQPVDVVLPEDLKATSPELLLAVQGGSAGMAMVALLMSRLLDLTLPAGLCLTGRVTPDGAFVRVGGIPGKVEGWIRHLRHHPFDASCFMVPEDPIIEAESASLSQGWSGGLMGVTSIPHLMDTLWPDHAKRLRDRFADPAEGPRLAARLFEVALDGVQHPRPMWPALRAAARTGCDVLCAADPAMPDPDALQAARLQLRTVIHIAARHTSLEPADLAQWVPFEQAASFCLSPADRRRLLAHGIQYAAEECAAPDPSVVEAARDRLLLPGTHTFRPRTEFEHEDLRILGAWGRFCLSRGDWQGAWDASALACDTWLARHLPGEASYPLSVLHVLSSRPDLAPALQATLDGLDADFRRQAQLVGCDPCWVDRAATRARVWREASTAPARADRVDAVLVAMHLADALDLTRWVRGVVACAMGFARTLPSLDDQPPALAARFCPLVAHAPRADDRRRADWLGRFFLP